MANVLGTLFGDIANAIREKSGESGTMKPAEFPEKISGISTGTNATILEGIPVALDLSNGNQTIAAPEGSLVKSAIIQKPSTLVPGNIAQGVDIAGVIGTLSGGGATGAMTGAAGSIDGSKLSNRTNVTVTHNMGKVPDFIMVYTNRAPVQGEFYFGYGFTQKIASRVPSNMNAGVAVKFFTSGVSAFPTLQGFENENVTSPFGSGTGHIRAVNETTFTVGGVNNPLSAADYMWVAYCGMV